MASDVVDLRERQQPPALTKLINARFLDEKTISRRNGHTATRVQDKSSFPIATTGSSQAPGSWVYGHGIKADFTNSGLYSEGAHWPVGNVRGDYPAFSWSPVPGATLYDLAAWMRTGISFSVALQDLTRIVDKPP
jgi:hypothetical protein